jgi:hypothetical protein
MEEGRGSHTVEEQAQSETSKSLKERDDKARFFNNLLWFHLTEVLKNSQKKSKSYLQWPSQSGAPHITQWSNSNEQVPDTRWFFLLLTYSVWHILHNQERECRLLNTKYTAKQCRMLQLSPISFSPESVVKMHLLTYKLLTTN